jgi:uncharacterized protein (TIGR01777 family)
VKVVIGGGSGYVGQALAASLLADGHEAIVLSRQPGRSSGVGRFAAWEDAAREVDGAAAVVNLAGVSIGGPRWTRSRKAAIVESRVKTTSALARAIAAATTPPTVFVTASGIDYYGASGDAVVDEDSPAGHSFLARTCVAWEGAAAEARVRHVALRTALVVGAGAPALRLTALPFRLFVGGPVGGGRQWFPWIHLDDLVSVYRLAIGGLVDGAVNAVAPEQLRQRDAARDFGAVLHRPSVVPTPGAAVRLLLGEEADLVLDGQRAVSRKLDDLGFRFRELRAALADALS